MGPLLELDDREPITYSSAANKDGNLINKLAHVPALKQLYRDLLREKDAICSLTKHHLGLGHGDVCVVLPHDQWLRGSFNVCVPVEVTSGTSVRKLMLRCCLPHKLAEERYPGTVDEKLGCEVGAYVWMQRNCSDIRIPHLYGFGFSDHRHVTKSNMSPMS